MSKKQLENKIKDLESWLTDNPNHPNRITIETDLRDFKNKLIKKEYE